MSDSDTKVSPFIEFIESIPLRFTHGLLALSAGFIILIPTSFFLHNPVQLKKYGYILYYPPILMILSGFIAIFHHNKYLPYKLAVGCAVISIIVESGIMLNDIVSNIIRHGYNHKH
jgi:hypothetical protein